jgi:hypothetical protein
MLSCDYNGWADVPEEEREAIDAFEAIQSVCFTPVLIVAIEALLSQVLEEVERRAA